jgi:hypothetical protein
MTWIKKTAAIDLQLASNSLPDSIIPSLSWDSMYHNAIWKDLPRAHMPDFYSNGVTSGTWIVAHSSILQYANNDSI